MAWEDSENKTKIYLEKKISEWAKNNDKFKKIHINSKGGSDSTAPDAEILKNNKIIFNIEIKENNSQGGSAATTLALSADVLRVGSQLLNPVMPEKTNNILNILGASSIPLSNTSIGLLKSGATLGEGKSPFPRIITE